MHDVPLITFIHAPYSHIYCDQLNVQFYEYYILDNKGNVFKAFRIKLTSN